MPDQHADFREAVRASRRQDPMPAFDRLAEATGTELADLVHHALVRWVSAGSEALLSLEPEVLRDLAAARRREDWRTVAGIIDWLEAGSRPGPEDAARRSPSH